MKNESKEKGNGCFRKGQYIKAISHYTQAINEIEKSVSEESKIVLSQCFANRAACYMKCSKFPEAFNDCNESIKLNPDYIKAIVRKCNIIVSLCDVKGNEMKVKGLLKLGYVENALLCEKVNNQKKFKQIYLMSKVMMEALKEMEVEYNETKDVNIKNIVYMKCALKHVEKSNHLLALKCISEINIEGKEEKNMMHLEVFSLKAECRIEMHTKYKTKSYLSLAIGYINDGLKISKNFSKLYYLRGIIEIKLKKIPQAIRDFEKAKKICNEEIESKYNLEETYKRKEHYEKYYQIAIEKLKTLPKPLMPSLKNIEQLRKNKKIQRILRDKKVQEVLSDIQKNPQKIKHYFEKYPKLYKCCIKIMKVLDKKFPKKIKKEHTPITKIKTHKKL